MRLAFILVTFVACTDSYGALSLDPAGGPPLGVGLVQRYDVTQDLCEGGVDGGCGNPVSPTQLAANVQSGTAVAVSAVTPFDGRRASVTLTGAVAGSAVVAITGYDDVTTAVPIDVAPVAATSLFVKRATDPVFGVTFPDVHSPVQAFAGSQIAIAQTNVGDDQSPRTGDAPLVLAGAVTYDATCECYTSGTTGTATFTAPLAMLELDIVDPSAIADFTIGDDPSTTLEFVATQATTPLYLLPTDATRRPIVGRGPDPVATIADPTIAHFYTDLDGDMRSLNIVTDTPGTTTLDVTWGTVHKTFTLHVVPLN